MKKTLEARKLRRVLIIRLGGLGEDQGVKNGPNPYQRKMYPCCDPNKPIGECTFFSCPMRDVYWKLRGGGGK